MAPALLTRRRRRRICGSLSTLPPLPRVQNAPEHGETLPATRRCRQGHGAPTPAALKRSPMSCDLNGLWDYWRPSRMFILMNLQTLMGPSEPETVFHCTLLRMRLRIALAHCACVS